MNVITTVAMYGGIAVCAAVIGVFVALAFHHRYTAYEGDHRFRDDEAVIPGGGDYPAPYPAVPVDQRPDGRPA